MSFIVDLLPPSKEIEAAAVLGLSLGGRKGKGFLTRKQYEAIEVVAKLALPIKSLTWQVGEKSNGCLVVDPHGFVSGSIKFDLEPKVPEYQVDPEAGEESFISMCQQWTKAVTDFTPKTLEFPGLITQKELVQPLLSKEEGLDVLELEEKADPGEVHSILTEELETFSKAAETWKELRQRAYAHRDALAVKLQEDADEARRAGQESLKEMGAGKDALVAERRTETDGAIAQAREKYQERRDLLQSELERFQQGFKEKGDDDYWREQIKSIEQRLAENEKELEKKKKELEADFQEFVRQQEAKIKDFKAELEKHMATFEQRQKRLDSILEGFNKGLDKRLVLYGKQPNLVSGVTADFSGAQCNTTHPVVFYAVRYPGNRWRVFPPQTFGRGGLKGAVAGLMGNVHMPFQPANKLAESLAEKLEKALPTSEAVNSLTEANLLQDPEFVAQGKKGLGKLIDQGKLDKKHGNLFDEL